MKWVWVFLSSLLAFQSQADVVSDLERCDGIVEPSERLNCFDGVVDRHVSTPLVPSATTSVQTTQTEAKPANRASVETSFIEASLSVETVSDSSTSQSSEIELPKENSATAPTAVADPATEPLETAALTESQSDRPDWGKPKKRTKEAMHATIAGVKKLPRGQYVLTFDDGQVWLEIEPRRQSRYSVGDEIVITRVFGGSFDLRSNATGYRNKVRRVE